jgi:uncharacterized membrane protein
MKVLESVMKATVASLLAVLLVTGCNYQVKKSDDSNGGNPPGSKPTVALYFADVQPILDRACVKCHQEFAAYDTLMKENDIVPGNASESPLFLRLRNNPGGDMPKKGNPLSDPEASLIRDWINGGALLGVSAEPPPSTDPQPIPVPVPVPSATPSPVPSATPTPAPEPALATFSSLEAQVFSKKCTRCHGDKTLAAGFSLEHYDSIVANKRLIVKGNSASSGLFVSVSGANAFMPPKRAVASGKVQKLTEDEVAALKAWIDAGAQQN